jgi:phage gpG-like protein
MLEVTVRGIAELEIALTNLSGALDTTKILDEAGALLFNRIRTRFLAQVDPDGGLWPESAAARKRALTKRGGGTLFDTGKLFYSLQLSKTGVNERSIGTDVPYAPYHNLGLGRQERRVFLGFGVADGSMVTALISKRIREALQ